MEINAFITREADISCFWERTTGGWKEEWKTRYFCTFLHFASAEKCLQSRKDPNRRQQWTIQKCKVFCPLLSQALLFHTWISFWINFLLIKIDFSHPSSAHFETVPYDESSEGLTYFGSALVKTTGRPDFLLKAVCYHHSKTWFHVSFTPQISLAFPVR